VEDPKSKDMKSRHLRLFLQEFRLASDVTQDSVEEWVDRKLFRDLGLSVKTAKTYISTYRTFWKHLNKLKLVGKSLDAFTDVLPDVRKTTQPKRDYFTPDDYQRLLRAVPDHDETLRDLIQLGAYTGCRIEELCNLKIQNVNGEYIKIADAKTDAGVRKVPLHSAVRQLVARLKDTTEDGYLLSGLTLNKYGDRSNAIGKRFGNLKRKLCYGPEHVFHSFRRGVVTQLEEAGVPENIAARIVGHDYKTMTFGTYSGGTTVKTMQEAIEVLRW
jgi:integrase